METDRSTDADPPRRGLRRPCPGCGEKVPARAGRVVCPGCGVDVNAALRERRYDVKPPDHRAGVDLLLKEGWWGGLAVMALGAVATSGAYTLEDPRALVVGPVFMAMGLWTFVRDLWRRARARRADSSSDGG